MTDWPALLDADRRHVWHPYGPMPGRARRCRSSAPTGVRLQLADGRELIDGMASWWCAIHGYRHPGARRGRRATSSARMAHVMFGGLTHEPRHRARRSGWSS